MATQDLLQLAWKEEEGIHQSDLKRNREDREREGKGEIDLGIAGNEEQAGGESGQCQEGTSSASHSVRLSLVQTPLASCSIMAWWRWLYDVAICYWLLNWFLFAYYYYLSFILFLHLLLVPWTVTSLVAIYCYIWVLYKCKNYN